MNGHSLVSSQLLYPRLVDPDWVLIAAGGFDLEGQSDLL